MFYNNRHMVWSGISKQISLYDKVIFFDLTPPIQTHIVTENNSKIVKLKHTFHLESSHKFL